MRPAVNRWAAIALAASLTGLLAALPAAPASASTASAATPAARRASRQLLASPSVLPTYEVGEWLSGSELSALLSALPIGGSSAPVSPEALAEALAGLPALQALGISDIQEALQSTFEGLSPEATLQLLQKPETLISTLTSTVESLLSPTELTELLDRLLLGGSSLSEELEEALSKVTDPEVLGALLGASGSPATLLSGLLGSLPASTLEGALGGTLEGGSSVEEIVRELAQELQSTPEALASEVGLTVSQLPSTATAITTPLSNGNLLGVLEGTDGAVLGTLKTVLPTEEGGTGGTGGTGGESGSGETGGSSGGEGGGSGEAGGESGSTGGEGSGSGGGSTGGSTGGGSGSGGGTAGSGGTGAGGTAGASSSRATGPTVLVSLAPASGRHGATPAHHHRHRRRGRLRVLRHRIRHGVLRLVVRTPGAGRIVVRGHMLRRARRHVGRARRLTLRIHLSRAGVAALRRIRARASRRRARHHRRGRHRRTAWMRLKLLFKPRHGRRSHLHMRLRL